MATCEFTGRQSVNGVGKAEYVTPSLTRIVLVPEENVLTICSAGSGTGQYPDLGCLAAPCWDTET